MSFFLDMGKVFFPLNYPNWVLSVIGKFKCYDVINWIFGVEMPWEFGL